MTEQPPTADTSASPTSPTRVCRKCSVQSTASGAFCPNCGKSYQSGGKRPSRRVALIAGSLAVLIVAIGVAGLAIKSNRDAQDREVTASAADAKERSDKLDAAASREAQGETDEAERESRRDLVKALERAITKDAKALVKDGSLTGPIKYSSCTATGGGSTDDLTALTGTFECIAVTKEKSDGTASGYGYDGTAEWSTGNITWQLQ